MQKLSKSQREFLWEASRRYARTLPGSLGEEYLASRGLSLEDVAKYGLGYVADPLPGHDQFAGWLAIPYLRPDQRGRPVNSGVVSLRFRCLEDHDHSEHYHAKYMSQHGDEPKLYNTVALTKPSPWIAVTEGELDCITAELSGIPAVGIPGSSSWRPHWTDPFYGYREVYHLADGDEAGRKMSERLGTLGLNLRVIPMPPNTDVNDFVLANGREALVEKVS